MKSFSEFQINEKELRKVEPSDANNFINDVLKLGSKQNLFDTFMKKNGISPDELSVLVNQVIDTLDKKWR
jgi:hypothetical protein